ncbi:hypothetical protein HDU86_000319 [Geranomyces michiganensis]|nr:hypothetical protein HDU86_000319 [Geranomyces michiganensis]
MTAAASLSTIDRPSLTAESRLCTKSLPSDVFSTLAAATEAAHHYACSKGFALILQSRSLSLIVGFHPSFQTFFFRSAGSSIGASLTQVGETSIPFQLIQRGGCLQRGPNRDATTTMPNRAIAFVVFCRLFLGPLIGLAFVGLLKAAHIAPADPMLVFVLLMESSTPPALNLAVIAELHEKGGTMPSPSPALC